jgi:hypothetical protein
MPLRLNVDIGPTRDPSIPGEGKSLDRVNLPPSVPVHATHPLSNLERVSTPRLEGFPMTRSADEP